MNIALVGNPNTGKTSLFNQLTGSYEYVGNWSGVTVEKKIGQLKNKKAKLIDLPGVYTLNPISKDEGVVSQFFLTAHPDICLNIIDASQLKRNLHLTLQLLEYGKPLVAGLNMMDVANHRGFSIDPVKLSNVLGIPVFPIIARTGAGCNELAEGITRAVADNKRKKLFIEYGKEIETAISKLEKLLKGKTKQPLRWLAIQALEGNKSVCGYIAERIGGYALAEIHNEAESAVQIKLDQFIYQKRQIAIEDILKAAAYVKKSSIIPLSEKIDMIVTNKFLGIPIFFAIFYVIFMLTFDWLGTPLSDALDGFMNGPLASTINNGLSFLGVSPFIEALVNDGIITGVGSVLVFVPQIFILFFFISLLEDSGYMARVAVIMDRIMEAVSLNGKAFIPMIIGFGCNVPGIMAARTIETPRERLLTILLNPFMSCSARLPVYALFVGAFFAKNKALVVLSLYVLGILLALAFANLFSKTILKGDSSVFVIELPPYRFPQFQSLWRSTWDKGKGFVKKAGTFIFAGSCMIWLLSYAGSGGFDVAMNESFLAAFGGWLAPVLAPLGFGTWQAGSALLTGFLAKEVIVSTMNITYLTDNDAVLQSVISSVFTPLSAYSFLVFVLLYVPCMATTATIYKETASKKWTVFTIGYSLAVAYLLSFTVYHLGKMLGFS
ncbi:ferrous iron transport protein B [Bacillaceae bacterium Marseille-Q3522]|nr:ferrous iron transport protein B [Bacillaceae bacterium Marseille-Q3522]